MSTNTSRTHFAITSLYPFCSSVPLWFSTVRSRITRTKLFRVTQFPNEGRTRNSNKSKPPGTTWIFLLWAAYKMQSNFYPYFDQHCTPPSLKFTDPASTSVYPIFKGINFHCLFPYSCHIYLYTHSMSLSCVQSW